VKRLRTREALKQLREGKLRLGKVFIYGDEYFLTDQFLKLARASFEFKEYFVDDENFPGNFYSGSEPSLFSREVLPILKGAEKLPSVLRSKVSGERFVNFVKRCDRIIISAGSIERKKLSNFVLSSLLKSVDFVILSEPLSDRGKIGLVMTKFKKAGRVIDQKLANFIVSSIPGDVQDLKVETDKLLAYPGKLTEELVEDLVFSTSTVSVFDAVEFIIKKDRKGFIEALDSLFSSGTDPLHLLSLLQTQVRQMIMVKLGLKVKLPGAVIFKYTELLRGVSLRELYFILKLLCEAEFEIKSGSLPKELGVKSLIKFI
jgi:DNA polymerase-3 subunit delta